MGDWNGGLAEGHSVPRGPNSETKLNPTLRLHRQQCDDHSSDREDAWHTTYAEVGATVGWSPTHGNLRLWQMKLRVL
jgi:hypothetical protein